MDHSKTPTAPKHLIDYIWIQLWRQASPCSLFQIGGFHFTHPKYSADPTKRCHDSSNQRHSGVLWSRQRHWTLNQICKLIKQSDECFRWWRGACDSRSLHMSGNYHGWHRCLLSSRIRPAHFKLYRVWKHKYSIQTFSSFASRWTLETPTSSELWSLCKWLMFWFYNYDHARWKHLKVKKEQHTTARHYYLYAKICLFPVKKYGNAKNSKKITTVGTTEFGVAIFKLPFFLVSCNSISTISSPTSVSFLLLHSFMALSNFLNPVYMDCISSSGIWIGVCVISQPMSLIKHVPKKVLEISRKFPRDGIFHLRCDIVCVMFFWHTFLAYIFLWFYIVGTTSSLLSHTSSHRFLSVQLYSSAGVSFDWRYH